MQYWEQVLSYKAQEPKTAAGIYLKGLYQNGWFFFVTAIALYTVIWLLADATYGFSLLVTGVVSSILYTQCQSRTAFMSWMCVIENPWNSNPNSGLLLTLLFAVTGTFFIVSFLVYGFVTFLI